jgi:hypothetical protein
MSSVAYSFLPVFMTETDAPEEIERTGCSKGKSAANP